MSEEKKQIFIDPNMFNPGAYTGGKTKKDRTKPDKQLKVKPSKTLSIKSQRQQFLKKLREKQEQQYISLFSNEKPLPKSISNEDEQNFISDFDKSLEFMNAVSNAPAPFVSNAPSPFVSNAPPSQLQPNHSYTIKNHNSHLNVEPPKYGCLKGGNLPTKRSFTQRYQQPLSQPLSQPLQQPLSQPLSQQPLLKQSPLIPVSLNEGTNVPGRLRSPEELQLLRKIHEQKIEASKPKPKIVQKQIKKIVRRTFQVGKNKHKPVISVLLPNKTIRNRVSSKSYLIKAAPISDVRKYLIKHGFIKVGSTAPTDVLRKMYESLVLIDGEVKNHNPDNLLFNFFQETKVLGNKT